MFYQAELTWRNASRNLNGSYVRPTDTQKNLQINSNVLEGGSNSSAGLVRGREEAEEEASKRRRNEDEDSEVVDKWEEQVRREQADRDRGGHQERPEKASGSSEGRREGADKGEKRSWT